MCQVSESGLLFLWLLFAKFLLIGGYAQASIVDRFEVVSLWKSHLTASFLLLIGEVVISVHAAEPVEVVQKLYSYEQMLKYTTCRHFLRLDLPLCCRNLDESENEEPIRSNEGGPVPLQRSRQMFPEVFIHGIFILYTSYAHYACIKQFHEYFFLIFLQKFLGSHDCEEGIFQGEGLGINDDTSRPTPFSCSFIRWDRSGHGRVWMSVYTITSTIVLVDQIWESFPTTERNFAVNVSYRAFGWRRQLFFETQVVLKLTFEGRYTFRWLYIDAFSDKKLDAHPLRLLTITRTVTWQDDRRKQVGFAEYN